MLKEISLTLFHNQELISLLLIEGVILIVSFMIYKSLKKKNELKIRDYEQKEILSGMWSGNGNG